MGRPAQRCRRVLVSVQGLAEESDRLVRKLSMSEVPGGWPLHVRVQGREEVRGQDQQDRDAQEEDGGGH